MVCRTKGVPSKGATVTENQDAQGRVRLINGKPGGRRARVRPRNLGARHLVGLFDIHFQDWAAHMRPVRGRYSCAPATLGHLCMLACTANQRRDAREGSEILIVLRSVCAAPCVVVPLERIGPPMITDMQLYALVNYTGCLAFFLIMWHAYLEHNESA